MYVSESEGLNFWLQVLTDLHNTGLKDILFASVDNLKRFSEAILSVYPIAEMQSCIVHQVCNPLKYVTSKDQEAFLADLKFVYRANTKDLATTELEMITAKWVEKYPVVIKSWQTTVINSLLISSVQSQSER